MKVKPPQMDYTIEELIEDPDGVLRPVKPEDLYMSRNRGVREAFRLIYELMKQKGYSDGDESDGSYEGSRCMLYRKK